jgi:hypothetical protein
MVLWQPWPSLLACWMTTTAVVVVQPMVPQHRWSSLACSCNGSGCGSSAEDGPQHCWPSLAPSRHGNDGSGTDDSALALLVIPTCSFDNNDKNGGIIFELEEAPASNYM